MQDKVSKKWFYAASDADGMIISTEHTVGADTVPMNTPQYLRPAMKKGYEALRMTSESEEFVASAVPSIGTANLPVILINFSNIENTYTAYAFSSLLFGTGNSMKSYYEEVSYGEFSISAGPAGVLGWYTAKEDHDYYGENIDREIEGEVYKDTDSYVAELVIEAVEKADKDIDFSSYDSNGDCYVDTVVIVHQGKGEEKAGGSSNISPHSLILNLEKLILN